MKGQRIEIFKNLKNIFLINNQHSLKSYKLGNIEKFSKEVFFRLTTFFPLRKIIQNFFFSIQFLMYCNVKKNFRVIWKIFEIFFFQNLLNVFWKETVPTVNYCILCKARLWVHKTFSATTSRKYRFLNVIYCTIIDVMWF